MSEALPLSEGLLDSDGEEPPGIEAAGVGYIPSLDLFALRDTSVATLAAPAAAPPAALAAGRILGHRFPAGPKARSYLRRHHSGLCRSQWNDWRWQLHHALRSARDLERVLRLSPEERAALIHGNDGGLPVSIPPYYAAQIDRNNPAHALRRAMVPTPNELLRMPGEADDPLGEDGQSPAPGLIHRYPDRALFLTTGRCAAYCRYCTRSRLVGEHCGGHGPADGHARTYGRADWEKAIDYIARHPAIRDVILSGGDPLTLTEETLEFLLARLRAIPHVEAIRIGTKTPAVLPMRITPALTKMLRKYHPLWMSLHFTHPDELTPEAEEACARLADAGIPLGSQTVLLAGVNDDVETLMRLFRGLMRMRVRPYYLYQCDPIPGSAHFRTPVEKGLEMIRGLRGHTSGYAVPTFVIDAPGGGGKVPLLPDYVEGRDGGGWRLRNYLHRPYRYPENDDARGMDPLFVKPDFCEVEKEDCRDGYSGPVDSRFDCRLLRG